jgi:hypothetical protein
MKRFALLLSALLLLAGCAHHPVRPVVEARHCDKGTYPVKAIYHGEVQTMCAIIEPECANHAKPGQTCPIVGYIGVGQVNTFLDPDADEAVRDQAPKKHQWWKIWKRSGKDRD